MDNKDHCPVTASPISQNILISSRMKKILHSFSWCWKFCSFHDSNSWGVQEAPKLHRIMFLMMADSVQFVDCCVRWVVLGRCWYNNIVIMIMSVSGVVPGLYHDHTIMSPLLHCSWSLSRSMWDNFKNIFWQVDWANTETSVDDQPTEDSDFSWWLLRWNIECVSELCNEDCFMMLHNIKHQRQMSKQQISKQIIS